MAKVCLSDLPDKTKHLSHLTCYELTNDVNVINMLKVTQVVCVSSSFSGCDSSGRSQEVSAVQTPAVLHRF